MEEKQTERKPEENSSNVEGLNTGLLTPKKNKFNNPKLFSSPASKARILTPIKTALQNSNRDTSKFIKKIQEIMDNKNKENVNEHKN